MKKVITIVILTILILSGIIGYIYYQNNNYNNDDKYVNGGVAIIFDGDYNIENRTDEVLVIIDNETYYIFDGINGTEHELQQKSFKLLLGFHSVFVELKDFNISKEYIVDINKKNNIIFIHVDWYFEDELMVTVTDMIIIE